MTTGTTTTVTILTWNTSATTTSTYSYYTSYAGSDSTVGAYYYYPSYTITYGGTSIDYFVRAKVCASGMLESNCQLQADGTTYKPTGVVQDKSEIMRFGVFSYFNSPEHRQCGHAFPTEACRPQ